MKLDYSRYRFVACVDWISFEVTFESSTNFMAVQRELHRILGLSLTTKVYVNPVRAGAGRAAAQFEFKLQNPKKWFEVLNVLNQLEKWKPFACCPRITGVEIALDAFNRYEYDYSALVSLAANYCVHLTRPASANRRFTGISGQKGTAQGAHSKDKIYSLLASKRGFFIGNKNDDWTQRIYVKTVDNSGKDILTAELHTARLENTYTHSSLSCNTLEEWSHLQFQQFSKHFHCTRLKETNSPVMAIVASANVRIGERNLRRHRTNGKVDGKRLYAGSVTADIELNKRIYDALRGLSARWAAK